MPDRPESHDIDARVRAALAADASAARRIVARVLETDDLRLPRRRRFVVSIVGAAAVSLAVATGMWLPRVRRNPPPTTERALSIAITGRGDIVVGQAAHFRHLR